ncbi:hypothetical protein BUE80_DR001616 [Diplocarpon rosae]|nr:hypothetical protein BUE80_DR001616 [Diplocarpon rosae]
MSGSMTFKIGRRLLDSVGCLSIRKTVLIYRNAQSQGHSRGAWRESCLEVKQFHKNAPSSSVAPLLGPVQ